METTGYVEDNLADAILAVTDEGLSINKAAQQYDVPRSTISSRLHGRGAQKDQVQPQ
jgi:DNA-directed RNA polymerase specialized sigma24 family protein